MNATAKPILHHVRKLADSAANLPDGALLTHYLAGDGDAFTRLVERHGPMVLGICRRLLGERLADDAFQAVFLALARRAKSLSRLDSIVGWLHLVARNASRSALRAESRRESREKRAAAQTQASAAIDEISARELFAVLDEEVGRLPNAYRLPLLLCFWQGLTQEQAAARLGWSAGSVKGRLDRGRKRLATRLTRRGYGPQSILIAPFATAAVSDELQAAAAQLPSGTAPPSVIKLAASLTASGATLRRTTLVLLAGCALAVAFAAAGNPETPPPQKSAEPEKPAPTAKVRTDRFGDPLPDGALMRLGTLAYRVPQAVGVAFRANGELVTLTHDLKIWIWPTGSSTKPRVFSLGEDPREGGRPAISPNGEFAVASKAGKVHVWRISDDGASDFLSRDLPGADKFCFSQNAAWFGVYARSKDSASIHICNLSTKTWSVIPEMVQRFNAGLSFTPDGKFLTIAGDAAESPSVSVIETAKAKETRYKTQIHNSWSASLSPDGTTLAVISIGLSGGNEPEVQLLSIPSGNAISKWKAPKGVGQWIRFADDGQRLFWGTSLGMREWDLKSGKVSKDFIGPAESPIMVSPDGRLFASNGWNSVSVWDAKTGKPAWPELVEAGHVDAILNSTVSPNGKFIATSSGDDEIRMWSAETGQTTYRLNASWNYSRAVVFLPDSKSFICVSNDRVTPILYDAQSGKELRRFKISETMAKSVRTLDLRLSQDGKTLATELVSDVIGPRGWTVSWDVVTGTIRNQSAADNFFLDELSLAGRISPDGRWKVMGGSVNLVGSTRPIQILPPGTTNAFTSPRFSDDSRLVALTGVPIKRERYDYAHTRVYVHHLTTNSSVVDVPSPGESAKAAFSKDDRLLAVVNYSDLAVWELASGQCVRRFTDPNVVRALTISFMPDGHRLVTGRDDCTALIWDVSGPRHSTPLTDTERARDWALLAGDDAAKAFAAEWDLADRPGQVVEFLRQRLKPVRAADRGKVEKLVGELEVKEYITREAAMNGLRQLGESAVPQLREMLKAGLAAESRTRVERLLAETSALKLGPGDRLRGVRAVAILEKAGTEDAKKLLRTLATGLEGARLTREARLAIERLDGSRYSESK